MEVIKNIIEYIAIIASAIILVSRTNYVLKYFQQSHYNFGVFKRIIKHYYIGKWQYFIWIVLLFIAFLDKWYVQLIYSFYVIGLFVLYFKNKDIIKLKITPRIYRIYFVILSLGTIISSALLLVFDLPELVASLSIILFILPLLIFISAIIIYPVEMLIAAYYHGKARRKLKLYCPDVIAITGSFGKTSTKNILFEFLKEKKITLATKKSYNTLNGISISINDDLTINDEVFIVEMGASKVGDISKLVKLAPPTMSIITGITAQHLETFKTVDNIVNEKMKLISALDSMGKAFINGDDEFIKNYKINTRAKIITFGFSQTCDYYASDIQMDANGMRFIINFKDTSLKVETKLLGRGNIYNILAAFSVAMEYGVRYSLLKHKISILEPLEHRLRLERIGSLTIIDDFFNSNKIGFLNALEVLSYFEGPLILITPGIVEGGMMEEELNRNLAPSIKSVVDEVVLIKTKASMFIGKGLNDLDYDNIKVFDSFGDAKKYVLEKYQKATILIENDISDIYKL